jgi:hypothetical protein
MIAQQDKKSCQTSSLSFLCYCSVIEVFRVNSFVLLYAGTTVILRVEITEHYYKSLVLELMWCSRAFTTSPALTSLYIQLLLRSVLWYCPCSLICRCKTFTTSYASWWFVCFLCILLMYFIGMHIKAWFGYRNP